MPGPSPDSGEGTQFHCGSCVDLVFTRERQSTTQEFQSLIDGYEEPVYEEEAIAFIEEAIVWPPETKAGSVAIWRGIRNAVSLHWSFSGTWGTTLAW